MSKSYDGINRLAKNNITKITTDTEFKVCKWLLKKLKFIVKKWPSYFDFKGIYGM
nr:MAG TPA: hypothetical protein [Caudoviricetes sp.]